LYRRAGLGRVRRPGRRGAPPLPGSGHGQHVGDAGQRTGGGVPGCGADRRGPAGRGPR